jgi:glyoxylase-like metal-dependent hydrolase (beta-lactamase superfamily II)
MVGRPLPAGVEAWLEPPAYGELAPVEPGIAWLRVRLPFALDHVNLWVLEDADGWTLVDTGVADPPTRAVWEAVLAGPLASRPVARVLVTHFHPDHFGLAAWLAARTGAELLMSRAEWVTGRMLALDATDEALEATLAHYRRAAMPEEVVEAQRRRGHTYRRSVPATPPAHRVVEAGQELALAGGRWRVLIGEGHAPEQVTLFSAERALLIAADQVLPRISPVVGVWASSPDADPLGEFLRSLRQYRGLPEAARVLPSHDAPFTGLHARLEGLAAHHEERLSRALDACRDGPATALDVLRALFPRRYDPHQMGFALGETLAHLNHLRRRGELERWGDAGGVWRFGRR